MSTFKISTSEKWLSRGAFDVLKIVCTTMQIYTFFKICNRNLLFEDKLTTIVWIWDEFAIGWAHCDVDVDVIVNPTFG